VKDPLAVKQKMNSKHPFILLSFAVVAFALIVLRPTSNASDNPTPGKAPEECSEEQISQFCDENIGLVVWNCGFEFSVNDEIYPLSEANAWCKQSDSWYCIEWSIRYALTGKIPNYEDCHRIHDGAVVMNFDERCQAIVGEIEQNCGIELSGGKYPAPEECNCEEDVCG
jgi:hypothetical protein